MADVIEGADGKRGVSAYREARAALAASGSYTAKVVRDWTRDELVPDAIKRMYDIGMGIQTFNTPTMAGNVVQVEAPAAVQRAALHDIIAIGLPAQIGLVDDDGNMLPGVIALGAFDMAMAQELAHGPRLIGDAIADELSTADRVADVLPPSSASVYEMPPDHEMIVVEEGIGTQAVKPEDRGPAPISTEPTPEQAVLARHRARMVKAKSKPTPTQPTSISENGNGNGTHPNLRD